MAAKQSHPMEQAFQQLLKQQVHLEFNGNREVIIEDCGGILEYTDKQVRVNASDCILRLQGRALQICAMTQDSIVLSGNIEHLDFLF